MLVYGAPVTFFPASFVQFIAVDAAYNIYYSGVESGNIGWGMQELVMVPATTNGGTVSYGPSIKLKEFSSHIPGATAIDRFGNIYSQTNYISSGHSIAFPDVHVSRPTGGYVLGTVLPPGLDFDPAAGTISGTPLAGSLAKNYYISAFNGGQRTTATTTIGMGTVNSSLSSLHTNLGMLKPEFNAGITSYTATVPGSSASIVITPAAADGGSAITVNGSPVSPLYPYATVPLATGQIPSALLLPP